MRHLVAKLKQLITGDVGALDPAAEPPLVANNDPEAKLADRLATDIRAGFLAVPEIVEAAVDSLSGEDDANTEALRPVAEPMVGELLAQVSREAESWPETTDCDHLDQAFAILEDKGIVCRQNFSCCEPCGTMEIVDEIEREADKGKPVHGYTFFHMQDTVSAVRGHGLCLSYGATDAGDGAVAAVADEIVRTIDGVGLAAHWDGTVGKRIGIEIDWKRRGPWFEPARCA